jgi:hypothetical protein
MMDIGSEFSALQEETEGDQKVKQKVRESFTKGKNKTGADVIKTARQARTETIRKKDAPADLIDVMREWTERARCWAELEQVTPYIEYIDSEPKVAERWRDAARVLIEKPQKFG